MILLKPYGEWDTALKSKYRKLKWQLLLQTMIIMLLSFLLGKMIVRLIIDGLFQGKISNMVISILMRMNLSYTQAGYIYGRVFIRHKDIFQWIGFVLLFLVTYYITLSRITGYLESIRRGIENVLSDTGSRSNWHQSLAPLRKN